MLSQEHRITQAEGGEQGDPLMPALFALAFAPALRDLHADLRPDEQALAFLDDAYILAPPHRVLELYQRFERHALHRAQLRLNPGKTRVWNSAGVHPVGVDSLAPDSDVWVGNRALDSAQRGFVALGVPFGTPEFIAASLRLCSPSREPSLTVYYSLLTLRLHGCFCLSVRPLVRSTLCAHCHLQTHEHTPLDMMPPSSLAWVPCCFRLACFGCRPCTARVAPRWIWTPQRRAPCRRGVLGILGRRAPSPRASRPCLRSSPRMFSGWPRAFASCLGCLEGCHRVPAGYRFPGPRVGCSAFGGAPCVARGRRR